MRLTPSLQTKLNNLQKAEPTVEVNQFGLKNSLIPNPLMIAAVCS